jgi:predicted DNA-binding protein (UPF0251 family)
MPRPFCPRRIAGRPAAPIFKPVGVPCRGLDEIVMTLDEFEAVRLADVDGLYQEQAAEQLGVSRPTFGRILESAHRKTADVLLHGKSLRIEGGPVEIGRRSCCRFHDRPEPDPKPTTDSDKMPREPGCGRGRRCGHGRST